VNLTLPTVSFRFERGQREYAAPSLFPFQTGAACAAPFSFYFEGSNGGSECCPPFLSVSNGGGVKSTRRRRFLCFFFHQETGKSYVAPARGYGGYTHHVTLSVVPIALVSLRSLVSGLGSGL